MQQKSISPFFSLVHPFPLCLYSHLLIARRALLFAFCFLFPLKSRHQPRQAEPTQILRSAAGGIPFRFSVAFLGGPDDLLAAVETPPFAFC
jgi:hypothetical protein